MARLWRVSIIAAVFVCWFSEVGAASLKEQNEALLEKLQRVHGLSDSQTASV